MTQQPTAPPSTSEPDESSAQSNRRSLSALRPLLPYVGRHKLWITSALCALSIASAATLVVPMAVRGMIDHGFSAAGAELINSYFPAMIGVVCILALSSGTRYFLVMTLGERIVAELRADVFAHLTKLDIAFYDTAKTGELLSRLTADTVQMKSAFGASASIALRNLFMFVGAIGLMIYTSPKLSALVLIAIPIIVIPLVTSGRSVRARSRAAQDTLADASAFASENLGAIRIMQAFNAQNLTLSRFASAVENSYLAARHATRARAILTTIAIFLAFASVVSILWLGAHDVLAGYITGGLLSQFVLFAVLGASALGQLSEVFSELSAAAGAAGRIADLLSIQPTITAPAHPHTMPTPPKGDISFNHISFAYPTRPHDLILNNLSFSIRSGERVAIVGPSGAGKSTLFQLLMRFYDPQQGSISIDGINIREADPQDLRTRLALVPQDAIMFGVSITDNIRYGQPNAPIRAVHAAAHQAIAHEFIEELPQGYDTLIGERGVTLSGGQRQRLAIARAIIKDAPILLLDEATSALDAENESLIQKALNNIMQGRTTLIIAHRLATVLNADRILVMEHGRIVEEGTHASLVTQNGLYARLARLQFETGASALADAAITH
jgi:ATP-binding cassette, subfamily B, bacterial